VSSVPPACDASHLLQVLFKFIWDFTEHQAGWEGVFELPFPWCDPSYENASIRLKGGAFLQLKTSNCEDTGPPWRKHVSSTRGSDQRGKNIQPEVAIFSFLCPLCQSFLFRWFSELIPILLQETHKDVIAQSLLVSLLT